MTTKDKEGQQLSDTNNYRLTIPPLNSILLDIDSGCFYDEAPVAIWLLLR